MPPQQAVVDDHQPARSSDADYEAGAHEHDGLICLVCHEGTDGDVLPLYVGEAQTPRLHREVWSWCMAWMRTDCGIRAELDYTGLAFHEYLLIGAASARPGLRAASGPRV